jgi:nitroreductase
MRTIAAMRTAPLPGLLRLALSGLRGGHPVAPVNEQWASAEAAVQNMLLAAESLGFGAMIVSGRKVATAALRNAFSLPADEHLMGFIAVGTPSSEPPIVERPAPETHLSTWVPAEL